jgi:arginyl-tRNA synthetase
LSFSPCDQGEKPTPNLTPMSLLGHLSEITERAFAHLGLDPEDGAVLPSQRPELSQFQCNGAMTAAKQAGKPPREIAEAVARQLLTYPEIANAEVAGPGFINISVTDETLGTWGDDTAADPRLGHTPAPQPVTVVVDYAGPNVAKAMHVGHLRATIIGDALARMFDFAGHKVVRDPHFGDWGFQMGLVITAIAEAQPDLPYFDPDAARYPETSPVDLDDLQRLYPQAAARAESDPEFAGRARQATVKLQSGDPGYLALWRHMKAVSERSQRADFAALGVEFDLWYGESDVEHLIPDMIQQLKDAGIAEVSDGALVVFVDEPGDKRDWPPLFLESRTGAVMYSTTDLATIKFRVEELGAELMIYVVDRRQADHFTVLFRAARKTGIAPPNVIMEHNGFGTMNGPDGRPFKTRSGGVVRLGDLIQMLVDAARRRIEEAHLAEDYPEEERTRIAHQVGVAALKFGDLINNPASDYTLDLDRFSSFEGKTGPYLQYAAVRIKSILRKAEERGLSPGGLAAPTEPVERDLYLHLLQLPEVVDRAIELRSPNHVAEYAFDLAGAFNRFYDRCHILSEPDAARQASWLGLARWTLLALERTLYLLGIEVPERM